MDEVANDDQPEDVEMDVGEPKIGDLIVVSLRLRPGSERPFAVGRILSLSRTGTFVIHWYGNSGQELEGTYIPE